ncbi:aldehyde dehydrogenase family protein [Aeromicrobium yanjiei]|uniref:Aldehyde dehydrogenase family protein n=1 Tax=Aeromicrobium yanjiei TaxID=2662028 RepID=A0A5Q2MHR6_9ACTN|nr:aldehyde dehydrogenase family protein [Aeromicrobium yanjiei]QGG40586.1 aldehyde dehydrogenase family protein [Aeromicrobium yanjiei]
MHYAIVDPATGTTVQEYPTATGAEVFAALAAADEAHRGWSRSSTVAERSAILREVARLHRERRDELAQIMEREMGKPAAQGTGEIDFSALIFEYYADNAEKFLTDEPIDLLAGTGTAVVRRSSLGVLLGIAPWNFPSYQVARFAAPNFAAGNTLLLKHAPQCPGTAEAIEKIFADAGAPQGSFVNIYATNEQVADLIADPRLQGVSLTGSERAGSAVGEQAGRHLKKVVLELGGSDPFIVLDAVDLDATVEAAAAGRLSNVGQVCNAPKRFIVLDQVHDAFVAKFQSVLKERAPQLAPMASRAAADHLAQQVRQAVESGAEQFLAGEWNGARVPAVILTGLDPEDQVAKEEFFGPVALVFRAKDEAHALEIANNTDYGLGSYVYGADADQVARVADGIEAGMVYANCVQADGVELPFGGIKRSGFGRELGKYGIDEFVNKKLIRTR